MKQPCSDTPFCCADATCAASSADCTLCENPAACDHETPCCDNTPLCCGDGNCVAEQSKCPCPSDCDYGFNCCSEICIYDWKCCIDAECKDNQYCCANNNKCTNRNKCCDGADTCYAKATGENLDCCWFEDTADPKFPFYQGPCGGTAKSFNNWGWTNGPYDLTGGSFASQSLDVYCGAGQCDTGKGFKRGSFNFTWYGTTFEAIWTPSMPDSTAGWELHLGCGTTGVYAKKKKNHFVVAPDQYEFRGTGIEPLKLTDADATDFDFSTCKELYGIAQFCSTNPGAD